MPVVSHWGVSGGNFAEEAGPALQEIDFSLVQTYSFIGASRPKARQVLAAAQKMFGVKDARSLAAPVGLAHAYDLTHILARAIDLAGSTERPAVRAALELVRNYEGLIKRYPQPFTPARHEALSQGEVFMARYALDGAIVRIADLSVIAADVLAELQKSEPLRRVDWQIESGLVAAGDANLLRVVLDNLLANAWKFTGKTANAKIEFGALRNAQGAPSFFLRDNGAGYDMSYADKLFGAFQRLHLVSDFPGTGIGLATVQRIVHRHGGRVWAEGAVGKGATFYFTL